MHEKDDILPVLASFWHGSDLSWVEQACVQSWLDLGHRFILFALHEIKNLPKGVEVRHPSALGCLPPFDLSDNARKPVAIYSDILRLVMCRDTDLVWVDMDALGIRPLRLNQGYAVGYGINVPPNIWNGVFRVPSHSPTITALLDFIDTPCPIQPWRAVKYRREMRALRRSGQRWSILDLPWGCSGPRALYFFMNRANEIPFVQPRAVYYPIGMDNYDLLHRTNVPTEAIEAANTVSVHVHGAQRHALAAHNAGLPVAGSYLEQFCARHHIDPTADPIVRLPWMDGSVPLIAAS